MNFPERGEIWLVVLDNPAVVISNERNNEFSNTITVLPVRSNTQEIYPFEVLISKEESGLPIDSKIKCNQIRTLDKSRLVKFSCKVTEEKLKEIEKALLIHLGI